MTPLDAARMVLDRALIVHRLLGDGRAAEIRRRRSWGEIKNLQNFDLPEFDLICDGSWIRVEIGGHSVMGRAAAPARLAAQVWSAAQGELFEGQPTWTTDRDRNAYFFHLLGPAVAKAGQAYFEAGAPEAGALCLSYATMLPYGSMRLPRFAEQPQISDALSSLIPSAEPEDIKATTVGGALNKLAALDWPAAPHGQRRMAQIFAYVVENLSYSNLVKFMKKAEPMIAGWLASDEPFVREVATPALDALAWKAMHRHAYPEALRLLDPLLADRANVARNLAFRWECRSFLDDDAEADWRRLEEQVDMATPAPRLHPEWTPYADWRAWRADAYARLATARMRQAQGCDPCDDRMSGKRKIVAPSPEKRNETLAQAASFLDSADDILATLRATDPRATEILAPGGAVGGPAFERQGLGGDLKRIEFDVARARAALHRLVHGERAPDAELYDGCWWEAGTGASRRVGEV